MTGQIIDIIANSARNGGRRRACIDLQSGETLTYAELDRRIDACAALLARTVAGEAATRIAMLSKNASLMLVVNFACIRLGWIFVPLNWRLSPLELAGLFEDAEPALLIAQPAFAAVGAELASRAGIEMLDTVALTQAIEAEQAPVLYERGTDPDATSTLLYTSGTSGRPKGVMLSEARGFYGLTNFVIGNRVTADSVYLCDMPMFHTAGLWSASRTVLMMGGMVAISEGFDAGLTLRRLGDPALAVTHYFCVVQMAQMLRAHPDFPTTDLSRLVSFCTGGAPNPRAHIEQWLDDGIPMVDGFGMSETGSTMGMPIDDMDLIRRKAGSVGVPMLSVEARIVNGDERDVAEGEAGELWIRGPNVSRGYWNKPAETAAAFAPGGWLRTGDIARRDADGFYYLVDRKKDMFISGGENVYPAEVEAMLRTDARIADVAVIGVPDARWGEVGCAYVVATPGAVLDAGDLIASARERLAHFKVPRHVVILDAIPRNAAGKALKNELRARFEARHQHDR